MPTKAPLKLASVSGLKVACATCSLRELCLPMGLGPGDLAKLDAIVNRRQRVKAGNHLYRAGDRFHSLCAIRSGFFKTYELNKDGQEQVSGFHMAGELMGLDAISADTHACNAIALEDSEVCEIPFLRLEELMGEIPSLQHQFHRFFSRELAADHGLVMLLGTMNAEERLAVFLLNLSDRLHTRGLSSTTIHLSMSREEIGNYLGLKLETVSRTFSKLQKDGLIEVERRNLTIKDIGRLREITECDRGDLSAGKIPLT